MVLQERFRASERLACRVVGQHRSTQRHSGKVVSIEEAKLRDRLREIAAEYIRWGRRVAYRLLWREEGLQRPSPRKRKRARPADGSVRRHRGEHPHQVWGMDFQFDATADGRRLKFLNVIDEHSGFCLAIRVDRRCKAKDVVAVLEELTSLHPAPAFIRSDNGPEFIAQALRGWCKSSGTTMATSSLDHPGRTVYTSRSTAGSGMSSSSQCCSPWWPRRRGLANRWLWEPNTVRPLADFQGDAPLEVSSPAAA